MNTSGELYPDIEIYLQDVATDTIMSWLESHFVIHKSVKLGASVQLALQHKDGTDVTCFILEKAVRAGPFTSVWFKTGKTPWESDRDCAFDAFNYTNSPVRCSRSGWQTDDAEDDDGWLQIDAEGEQEIVWKT